MDELKVSSGVETAPVAGGQDGEFDIEAILFGDDSEEGVEEEDAADPAVETEQDEEGQALPDDASKAFAAKWAAESEKLEQKIRTKVTQELEEKTRNTPQAQSQGEPTHRDLTPEELEKLAEDLDTSPKVANILYQQQQLIARQTDEAKKTSQRSKERDEYSSATQYAKQLKEANPSMPDWDGDKVQAYRMEHYKQYGATLPWKEAYKMQLADSVLTGDVTRQAQQEAIRKIQERDTASVGLKAPSTQKLTIDDLSKDQFRAMKEQVLLGKYKRS